MIRLFDMNFQSVVYVNPDEIALIRSGANPKTAEVFTNLKDGQGKAIVFNVKGGPRSVVNKIAKSKTRAEAPKQ